MCIYVNVHVGYCVIGGRWGWGWISDMVKKWCTRPPGVHALFLRDSPYSTLTMATLRTMALLWAFHLPAFMQILNVGIIKHEWRREKFKQCPIWPVFIFWWDGILTIHVKIIGNKRSVIFVINDTVISSLSVVEFGWCSFDYLVMPSPSSAFGMD